MLLRKHADYRFFASVELPVEDARKVRFVKLASAFILLICGLFAVVAVGLHITVIRPLEQLVEPATPKNARVDMLDGEADALILSAFVTGDVPRLIRGAALEARSDALWFTDNSDAGNMVGAVIFGMMGMPPSKDIGTAFVDGIPTAKFSCLTVGCIDWPNGDTRMWGLSAFRGQDAALGPEVKLERQTFTDYQAYLAAHTDVLADPLRWFTEKGAEIPQSDTDGLRLVVISLPTRLTPSVWTTELPEKDAAMQDNLTTLANTLIDGLEGEVQEIHGATPLPLWVTRNDEYLSDAKGGRRALPDLMMHNPTLRLRVPKDGIPIVRERLTETALSSADYSAVQSAVERAFVAWGLETECLPQCGGIIPPYEFRDRAAMDAAGAPFWVLSEWQVPSPKGL